MSLITAVISLISGLLCSMGFGGGSVLIIFLRQLLNVPQLEAQGINLIFFIPCAVYSVIQYNKSGLIDKSLVKPFVVWGIIGVAIGYLLINSIPEKYPEKIFGMLLVIIGIKDLLSKKQENTG